MNALRKRRQLDMTVPGFLAWAPAERSGRRWQLVDGEPVAMAPHSQPHAAIQAELGALIRNHLVARGSPCRVLVELGIVPRVRADKNFRIPDLGVTCSPRKDGVMAPDPVLLVEILSPGNESETRANVWSYATIPSVQEILLLHSTRIEAELLRRRDDATWPGDPVMLGPDSTLQLASIGFVAALTEAYRTTDLAARKEP